jgi:hypothetical protein
VNTLHKGDDDDNNNNEMMCTSLMMMNTSKHVGGVEKIDMDYIICKFCWFFSYKFSSSLCKGRLPFSVPLVSPLSFHILSLNHGNRFTHSITVLRQI